LEDCGGSSYCLNRSSWEWKQLRDQEEQEWLRKQLEEYMQQREQDQARQQELQQQLEQQHEQQQQLQLKLDQQREQQKQLEEQLEQQQQQLQRRDNTLVLDNSSMLNVLLDQLGETLDQIGETLDQMVICVGPEQVAAPEPREITELTDD